MGRAIVWLCLPAGGTVLTLGWVVLVWPGSAGLGISTETLVALMAATTSVAGSMQPRLQLSLLRPPAGGLC